MNLYVFAFGTDLNDIKYNDSNSKTQIVLNLSKLSKSFHIDKSNDKELKITLPETYLGSKLIKNLDIILNDNIQWKQLSDKLIITIKHKGISNQIKVYNTAKSSDLIVEIPKMFQKPQNTVASSVKALPPNTRPVSVSRSISNFRDELPQHIINFRNNPNNKISQAKIYPGVNYMRIQRITKSGPLMINVLDIAPNNPYIEVLPALANEKIMGKKTIRTIVSQNNGLAGVNAGFFKPPTGRPLGTVIIDDELISGPIYDRVTLGITRNNQYRIERIHLTGQIVNERGQILKMNNVNQPRISKNQYLLYSYRWGWTAPSSPEYGKQISIENGYITNISADPLSIPRNGYVVIGPDEGVFSSFRVGDKVKMVVTTDPDWSDVKHAIGGGPFLVKNSEVYVDHEEQQFSIRNVPEPRTAVGVTQDDHLLLVTVDGRQKGKSIGVTFYQLAALMIELGAVNAMNLDGGSSTQMCVKQEVVNSPTVSGGNAVSNGLIVIPKLPNS